MSNNRDAPEPVAHTTPFRNDIDWDYDEDDPNPTSYSRAGLTATCDPHAAPPVWRVEYRDTLVGTYESEVAAHVAANEFMRRLVADYHSGRLHPADEADAGSLVSLEAAVDALVEHHRQSLLEDELPTEILSQYQRFIDDEVTRLVDDYDIYGSPEPTP
jgi:hypothetical protein